MERKSLLGNTDATIPTCGRALRGRAVSWKEVVWIAEWNRMQLQTNKSLYIATRSPRGYWIVLVKNE